MEDSEPNFDGSDEDHLEVMPYDEKKDTDGYKHVILIKSNPNDSDHFI